MEKNFSMESNIKAAFSAPIFGLILAGGKSSRMGFDKGLINYHGKPQREYLFHLLAKHCKQVFTSCKNSDDIPETLNPLRDQFLIDSPLNGILSAFQSNKSTAWLTVPVDMPMVDEVVIAYLIQHRDTSKSATCFFDSDGKNPEPLFTIWEPSIYENLIKFNGAGESSPRDFLIHSDINIISIPDTKYLLNINNEQEWRQFKKDQNNI